MGFRLPNKASAMQPITEIDPKDFHHGKIGREAPLETCLVLDLASAIHASRDLGSVVSWEAQVEASQIFNEQGFEGANARLADLLDERLEGARS